MAMFHCTVTTHSYYAVLVISYLQGAAKVFSYHISLSSWHCQLCHPSLSVYNPSVTSVSCASFSLMCQLQSHVPASVKSATYSCQDAFHIQIWFDFVGLQQLQQTFGQYSSQTFVKLMAPINFTRSILHSSVSCQQHLRLGIPTKLRFNCDPLITSKLTTFQWTLNEALKWVGETGFTSHICAPDRADQDRQVPRQ